VIDDNYPEMVDGGAVVVVVSFVQLAYR